jgi:tetratricopeptide (TPR) repeat protein
LLGVGDALRILALTYKNLGDEVHAAKVLEESALWCYDTGETMTLFNSLNYLAAFNAPRAIELGEMVLAKQHASGNAEGIAATLQALGRIHFKKGSYAEARHILEECHARWQALGRLWSEEGGTARCLWDLGPVLGFLGEGERGAVVLSQARDEYEQAGDEHGVAWAVYFRGQVLMMSEDVDGAEREMRECLRQFLAQSEADGVAITLCKLGEIALMRGDSQRALRLIGSAMTREPNLHVHDMPPPWREAHQRTLSWGRAHVDDSALIEGQEMTLDQVVDYALSESVKPSHPTPRVSTQTPSELED